jgi:DNA polymerase V
MQPFTNEYCTGPVPVAADPAAINIPLMLFRPPCGFPSPAADYIEDELDIGAYLIKNKAASFWFTVVGRSMEGIGIFNGDKILVDRSITPRAGHVVLAIIDDAFTVKMLAYKGGQPELHAASPDYAPIQFKDGQELRIWGVVIASVKKFHAC